MKELNNAREPTGILKELISKAQFYDQESLDELYMRFRGMVINCIKRSEVQRTLGEDAENVAWEIFYNAVHSMDVEHTHSVENFLKASLYNGIRKHLAKHNVPCVPLDMQDEENQSLAVAENVYETVLASYAFASFIRELPEKQQKLMQMLYRDGMSITEASRELGRSYKATAKLKYKCLRKLRKYLSEE